MTRTLFGTDGIRGTANVEPMTAQTSLLVSMATAHCLRRGHHRHTVVIGKDTRLSGYMIESAMTAGFTAMGMDVVRAGPIPTPAVAMLIPSLRADFGVVISASHNPFQDNGIKIFGPDGFKLSDAEEAEIESVMANGLAAHQVGADEIGKVTIMQDARGRYIEAAKATFPRDLRLDGLKVVLDCAHGAAYQVAPQALWELGAEVIEIGTAPDGFNINRDVGATATEAMQREVVDAGADLGIALDGDADRVILADENGNKIDGDQLMGLIATARADAGELKGGGVVATVMSNLGLERYLDDHGLHLRRTSVGDRYVAETMRADGYNVGGEQSGHIILGDHATTGDGLIAALQVLSVLRRADKPASQVCRVFDPVPQVLRNVRYERLADGATPLDSPDVQGIVAAAKSDLGHQGRILIRKSGTEPLIRVMGEGDDPTKVGDVVGRIVEALEKAAA